MTQNITTMNKKIRIACVWQIYRYKVIKIPQSLSKKKNDNKIGKDGFLKQKKRETLKMWFKSY